MKKLLILAAAGLIPAAAADPPLPASIQSQSPLEWSRRMADSEIARRSSSHFHGESPTARWEYTSGLMGHALLELGKATGQIRFTDYGSRLATSFVGPDGTIATYQEQDYNIDMILPGRILLACHETQPAERLRLAAGHLRAQLARQPRTSDGGFWHKQRYPWQMWLDGLYMGAPFLAHYGRLFNEPAAFDEVVKQIRLMDRHSYDPTSGLFFHGWDEKRQQPWANPQTGRSRSFWGRAVGWYAMAIVDVLDHLPPDHPGNKDLTDVLRRLADGVIKHQDPASGLWWQALDQPDRKGNYLEASASAMFTYALAKGVRRGFLARERYLPCARKGYHGLVTQRIRIDATGAIHLTHNCEVAGLGLVSSKGIARDGSFAYYISEPVVENDWKGVGPFILAGIEMQQLAGPETPPAR